MFLAARRVRLFALWTVVSLTCISAGAYAQTAEKPAEPPPQLPSSGTDVADPEVPPALEAPPPPPPEAEAEAPAPTTYEIETDDTDSVPEENVHWKMQSPVTFGAGLVIGGVGFLGLVTGIGFRYGGGDATCPDCPLTDTQTKGVALMLTGGLAFVVGGVMVWYGARPVRAEPWAKAIPAVGVGVGNVKLKWAF